MKKPSKNEEAVKAGGGAEPSKAADAAKTEVIGKGELRSSKDKRSGLVSGIKSFGVKRVRYSNVNGMGIFEGDIAIGPVDKLAKSTAAADTAGFARKMPASGNLHGTANVAFAAVI